MGQYGSFMVVICVTLTIINHGSSDSGSASPVTGNFRHAKTMKNWVYFKVPRIEALVIKLQTRAMHPGVMSCWKNLISVTEFYSEFLIFFPTARRGSTYSIIIFSTSEVFYVKYGITADTVLRGIKGPDSSVKNLLPKFFGFMKVYITIFEENPLKRMSSLDPATLKLGFGLNALDTITANTQGMAGKVCMQILSDNFRILNPPPKTLNHVYEKRIESIGNGS